MNCDESSADFMSPVDQVFSVFAAQAVIHIQIANPLFEDFGEVDIKRNDGHGHDCLANM
jgi:hypothetical protein